MPDLVCNISSRFACPSGVMSRNELHEISVSVNADVYSVRYHLTDGKPIVIEIRENMFFMFIVVMLFCILLAPLHGGERWCFEGRLLFSTIA